MDSWTNYRSRPTSHAEQILYDHWLNRVQMETPEALIERFRLLFVDGLDYPEKAVRRALFSIINSGYATQQFKFIVNRSCYIPINRWLMQPNQREYVPQLVELFNVHPRGIARTHSVRRLRELVKLFVETDQYATLRRLEKVVLNGDTSTTAPTTTSTLGELINRYPYLYEHSLLTVDSTEPHKQNVRLIQTDAQQQFEQDLSQYLIYRRLQVHRHDGVLMLGADLGQSSGGTSTIPRNPTLLSDRQLDEAVDHFCGRFDGTHTYRDFANHFLLYSKETRSYQSFKAELYAYLTESLDLSYPVQRLTQRIQVFLKELYADWDNEKLQETLMVNTCQKLLNFLVVESRRSLEHSTFLELLCHLGNTLTIGLLLKIALICRKVKPWLEKRFAILFNHYEGYAQSEVNWLVESLEHLNIAFCTNFGDVRVSLL